MTALPPATHPAPVVVLADLPAPVGIIVRTSHGRAFVVADRRLLAAQVDVLAFAAEHLR